MTDKQMEEKKKQFVLDTVSLLERELTENDLDIIFGWIEQLVEEVEGEALEKIVGLSIEMEGSFNNAFGTALNEIYYRLSDGKFLDEVLGEKDKGTN